MATHSSILTWRSPWTEGPGGLQSMVLQRATNTLTFHLAYRLEPLGMCKEAQLRTSLVVQCSGLQASTAGGLSSTCAQGTKTLRAQCVCVFCL